MSKDPFQILADEVTLARQEIQKLQRTSLDREEAEDLNQIIIKSQADMLDVGLAVEKKIELKLNNIVADVKSHTMNAAKNAAVAAIQETRLESLKVANDLSKAAGEARQQAWRYFGGFWVWLLAVGALGALLGALVMFWMTGHRDAKEFGKYPGVYCGSAGGEKGTAEDGRPYCVFWLD